MKKIVQIISLMLVLTMLLPMIPIGVFAEESDHDHDTPQYENINETYTIDEYRAVNTDGSLPGVLSGKAGEYSKTIVYKTPAGYTNYTINSSDADAVRQTPNAPTYASQEAALSFAHDREKIYIGIYDKSGTASPTRNGYTLRFGFDPEHPENYIGLFVQCVEFTFDGSSKTDASNLLETTDTYDYAQAGFRGLALSNGSYYWQANLCDYTSSKPSDGLTRYYYTDETAATYPITAMKMVREDVDGEEISQGGYAHGRIASGQHHTYFEIEIDKAKMLTFFNQGAGENPISDVDEMLFSLATADTISSGENVMWNGSFDADVNDKELGLEAYNYDLIQFNTPENLTNTYRVDGYKSAKPDGTIIKDENGNANEYSVTADLAISGKSGSTTFNTLRASEYSEYELSHVSEAISMSFAHDANKIYIGVYDKSGTDILCVLALTRLIPKTMWEYICSVRI